MSCGQCSGMHLALPWMTHFYSSANGMNGGWVGGADVEEGRRGRGKWFTVPSNFPSCCSTVKWFHKIFPYSQLMEIRERGRGDSLSEEKARREKVTRDRVKVAELRSDFHPLSLLLLLSLYFILFSNRLDKREKLVSLQNHNKFLIHFLFKEAGWAAFSEPHPSREP